MFLIVHPRQTNSVRPRQMSHVGLTRLDNAYRRLVIFIEMDDGVAENVRPQAKRRHCASTQSMVRRNQFCFWRTVRHRRLTFRNCSQAAVCARAHQRKVNTSSASRCIRTPGKIRICVQGQPKMFNLVSNPRRLFEVEGGMDVTYKAMKSSDTPFMPLCKTSGRGLDGSQ